MTDLRSAWGWSEYTRCQFCGDKTDCQAFGQHAIYLCRGCCKEWRHRFPETDPADLKHVICGRCDGYCELPIDMELTTSGWEVVMLSCRECRGRGWRLAPKSPLEHLAEVGMEEQG